jgi:hypothetical protein
VQATDVPLGVLQDSLPFGVGSRLRNDLESFHACALARVAGPWLLAAPSFTASNASLVDEQIGHKWSCFVSWRISFSCSETLQKAIHPLRTRTRFHSFTKNPRAVEP